jgi:hypothetical protein
MTTRVFTLEDLLAQEFTPISTLGIDNVNAAMTAHLDFMNRSVSEQQTMLAEQVTDPRRIWGTSSNISMVETDEFGDGRTQSPKSGVEVGFPMRRFSVATGWTTEWLQRAMAPELARRAIAAENAYLTRMQEEIQFAIFNKTNYTFKDFLGDNTALSVKAFLNADSTDIPDAPNGTAFTGSSHQHYAGKSGSALIRADIDTLISNVVEHGLTGVTLFVDTAMPATLSALTGSQLVGLIPSVLIAGTDSDSAIKKLDVDTDPSNRLVGYWNGYPVHTRSWVPTGYIACLALGSAEKPLAVRVDKQATLRGLLPIVEYGQPNITAKIWRSYFGVSVWNRAAGAVLDTTAITTYGLPSLIRVV